MQGRKALARQIAPRQFSWSECCRAGSPLVLHEVQKAMPNSESLGLTTWHFFITPNVYQLPLHYGWVTLVHKGGEAVSLRRLGVNVSSKEGAGAHAPSVENSKFLLLQHTAIFFCGGREGPQCLRISPSMLHLCEGSALWHIAARTALCFFPELPAWARVRAVVRVVMLWLLSGTVPLAAVICTRTADAINGSENCKGNLQFSSPSQLRPESRLLFQKPETQQN